MAELGRTGRTRVVGYGTDDELEAMLGRGDIFGLVVPDTFAIGYSAVRIAYSVGQGLRAPGKLSSGGGSLVRSTRRFTEPHDYPPIGVAAYGIVAFPQLSTSARKQRWLDLCEAYMVTFPLDASSRKPLSEQMVTVWPIDDRKTLLKLVPTMDKRQACELAVEHYDLPTALTALKEAQAVPSSISLTGEGPYLLAWAPSSNKGSKDALVLVRDLSGVTTQGQFLQYFLEWSKDIEENPSVWQNGFTLDRVRLAIRNWFDKVGTLLLPLGHVEAN